MGWAAAIPAGISLLSSLSQSGGGNANSQPLGTPQQGANGWAFPAPTGGTLYNQEFGPQGNAGGGDTILGKKKPSIFDLINPAGSTSDNAMSLLAPDPLSQMLNSFIKPNDILKSIFGGK